VKVALESAIGLIQSKKILKMAVLYWNYRLRVSGFRVDLPNCMGMIKFCFDLPMRQ
jgi:hypothetical protein